MHYDPDANIISIELSVGEIEFGKEFGNFIIHFSPLGTPVLLEILEADKFAKQFNKQKLESKIKEAAAC